MKSLIKTVLTALLLSILANVEPTVAKDSERSHEWICSFCDVPADSMPDTYIFYWHGHNGANWGMIYPDSTGPRIVSGTTRDWVDEDSCESLIDTTMFLQDNAKTIKWAFDFLPSEAMALEPCADETYSPFFWEVFIVKDSAVVFRHPYNTVKYDGPNSEVFNSKLRGLFYLMFWISSPSIRHHLVTPCDRPHPTKMP